MKKQILKFVLVLQGLYYLITALWALLAFDSFTFITNHPYGHPFIIYANAGLIIVIGIAFIYSSLREKYFIFGSSLVIGSAIAIVVPEVIYFQEIRNTLFVADFLEEITIAAILGFILISNHHLIKLNK